MRLIAVTTISVCMKWKAILSFVGFPTACRPTVLTRINFWRELVYFISYIVAISKYCECVSFSGLRRSIEFFDVGIIRNAASKDFCRKETNDDWWRSQMATLKVLAGDFCVRDRRRSVCATGHSASAIRNCNAQDISQTNSDGAKAKAVRDWKSSSNRFIMDFWRSEDLYGCSLACDGTLYRNSTAKS